MVQAAQDVVTCDPTICLLFRRSRSSSGSIDYGSLAYLPLTTEALFHLCATRTLIRFYPWVFYNFHALVSPE
jgi:hypothetical protein